MMTAYEPLTITTTDGAGNEKAECRFYGTEKCQSIHMSNGCYNCPVFKAILKQLNTFEQIYMED